MNGKKWVITAIITVCVLALVAMILGTVLVVKVAQAWDGNSDGGSSISEIFEPQYAVEEPPMEPEMAEPPMAPEGEAPAVIEPVELDGPLGILVPDEGDSNMRMLETFGATCDDHGIPTVLFAGNGDPLVIREAAISMLEVDGVTGIAACTLDPVITEELVDIAAEYGVPVISIDAAMDAPRPEGVVAHIDSWGSGEDVAFELLMKMAEVTGGTGRFGVVTPFNDDPIYDSMEQQIGMYAELENTVWRASGHGNGTDESCRESIIYMLERYDLDALICTEPQTTNAAIIAMEELGMDIPIIGFTNPSMVADIGGSNVTAVWHDPRAAGELAARSLIGLLTGNVVFEDGEFVHLGNGDSYMMETIDGVLTMWVNPLLITQDNAEALRGRE